MMNRMTRGVAVCLTALMFSACEAPNWEDPAYVSKQMTEGDSAQQSLAMERLSQLTEEKQRETIPALVALYLKGGGSQKAAMQVLVQLRDVRAKDAYLEEVKTNQTGYAASAAAALGELKVEEAIDPMLEVLAKSDNNDTKLGVIQALAFMPSPKLVGPLVEILKLDVDNSPIAMHAYACEVLGAIALAHPDAITDEVVKILTLAMFYGNNLGQTVDRECGLAVQRTGDKAGAELVKIFKGERQDIQSLMMKYDSPKSPFPQNHPKLIAAKRLASLRIADGVQPMIDDLMGVKAAPKTVAGNAAVNWRIKEGQSTSEILYALGDLGDAKAVPALTEVVSNKIAERWDDITDGMVELQLRQDAASALNRIGDRSALPALLKEAKEGVVIDFERRAAMLEKGGTPVKQIERYQFNWMVGAEYAYLATSAQKGEFEKLVADTTKKYPDLGAKMGEYVVAFDTFAECDGKGSDAEKASCYGGKINDANAIVRSKAAWELSRLPGPEVAAEIVKVLDTSNLDAREILTFALYRNPTKDAVTKISEIIKKEEANRAVEYKLDHFRLELLSSWLRAKGLG